MIKLIISVTLIAFFSKPANAIKPNFGGISPFPQEKMVDRREHTLDGVTVEYQYQSGMAIHMELENGLLSYEWVSGPAKGGENKNLPYRTRQIDKNVYIVNWYESEGPDYITLILNFNTRVMYSSGILMLGTKKQFSLFEGGIISYNTYELK
jgi:hypothetical protein